MIQYEDEANNALQAHSIKNVFAAWYYIEFHHILNILLFLMLEHFTHLFNIY